MRRSQTIHKRAWRKVLLILGIAFLLCQPYTSAAASNSWRVLFNGVDSDLEVIESDSGLLVPIYFPVAESAKGERYTIHIRRLEAERKLRIDRHKVQEDPTRGPGDCRGCNGDKKCQSCYPAASKVNYVGESCYHCNATGTCPYCAGKGVCYSCDGKGFDTGCNVCGKVLES